MDFADQATADIYSGHDTRQARKALPRELHERAARLMDRIAAAARPSDLKIPRGNRLHKLTGNRGGQWSVSINDQYRICFKWEDGRAAHVEITDYH